MKTRKSSSCHVSFTIELPVTPLQLWIFLEKTPAWHPFIQHASRCGPLCFYTLVNGEKLIHKFSPWPTPKDHYAFSYQFLTGPYPLKNYISFVVLSPKENGCRLYWSGSFVPYGVPKERAIALLTLVYKTGLDHLLKTFPQPIQLRS